MAQMEWTGSDYRYEHTMEHVVYLKLPFSMVQGKTYTLTINGNTNTDVTTRTFTYDIFNSRSEAVHVNVVGYYPTTGLKAADLYAWLGDGGARDYTAFQGRKVFVYNVATGVSTEAGTVTFWKASAGEAQGYNFTQSAVWNADFTAFTGTGTYRLAVEGVGCSDDFKIDNSVYLDPYKVSVRGFYYMRIGQNNNANLVPAARTPLYIPNVSPATTKVYLTTMQPYHPNWTTFAGGDVWDAKDEWAPYMKPGSPQNPNAWGGHSDAADWDRHLGHVSIIYDLLLPYFLSKGKLSDDNLGIAESGNGIPDILDEARFEVDFWLRLRDGRAYSHGLNNPNSNNVFYQAGPTAVAAWANAANAAMLAECFRIGGNTTLTNTYRDSAVAAYNFANGLADKMLDNTQNVGEATLRGRDFKQLAAAFLFNVTGNTAYEDALMAESVVTTANSAIISSTFNQIWATAAYALTHRAVRYPALQSNMKASLVAQAKSKETNYAQSRPSRRSTDNDAGYFHTIQNVHHTLIAHALSADGADKTLFTNAMLLEADWGLGRNPLNFIQMGTTATPLAAERSVENLYTSGREDGITGVHPGQTPYLNTDDWYCAMVMGCPGWMTSKLYPLHADWPKGETYFNTRWVWAHSEFTPQQTMRGKMALYGYLYALGSGGTSTPVAVTGVSVSPTSASVAVNGTQQLTATVSPTNATNKTVSWSSGNTAVATVSSTGLVTGVAAGTATITVTTQDGAKTASATVTVTAAPSASAIINLSFDANTGTTVSNSGSAGGSLTKTAPPDWSVNVPVNGGTSSLDFGTTTGNFVVESSAAIPQLAGLNSFTITGWLNAKSSTEGFGGNRVVSWINNGGNGVDLVYRSDGSLQLGVNEWPDNSAARSTASKITANASAPASNWKFFAVTYNSANATVQFYFGDNATTASLDVTRQYAKGAVGSTIGRLAIGHFNAATRSTALDRMFRGLIDKIEIYGDVLSASQIQSIQGATSTTVAVTGVSVTPASASVAVGATQQLTATVSPSNATNKTVSWSSSNTAVATVSSTGLVTGVAAGTATITVTTQDGAKTATSAITVTAASTSSTLTIRARGTCGTETMELRVNDLVVQTWNNVSSTVANYTYTGFTGGNVKVAFTNDATSPCDRNLFVDYIQVGATTYQTDVSATRVGCGDAETLWCAGHFDFGTRSARLAADGSAETGALSLLVSPNPTGTGRLRITLPASVPAFGVDLTGLTGSRIKGQRFTGNSGELSVAEVGAGFYLLRVYVADRVLVRKVLVRK
ncbi:MAG TPA: Ig-like domain-containing protein, partial [Cytophagales bacterium]|jgi:uncharacterized protein YjdB